MSGADNETYLSEGNRVMITTDPNLFLASLLDQSPAVVAASTKLNPKQPPQRWPGLMSRKTLAEYLDVSGGTLDQMVKRGELPPASLAPTPRLRRWSKSAIDEHFNKKEQAAAKGTTIDDLLNLRSSVAEKGGCYASHS